jgi:hypothetical protein
MKVIRASVLNVWSCPDFRCWAYHTNSHSRTFYCSHERVQGSHHILCVHLDELHYRRIRIGDVVQRFRMVWRAVRFAFISEMAPRDTLEQA